MFENPTLVPPVMLTDNVDAARGAGLPSFVMLTGPLSSNPPVGICVTVPPCDRDVVSMLHSAVRARRSVDIRRVSRVVGQFHRQVAEKSAVPDAPFNVKVQGPRISHGPIGVLVAGV